MTRIGCLSFIFLSLSAHAEFSFEGSVTIRGSRDGADSVTLFLLPDKLRTTTDGKGAFRLEGIPEAGLKKIIINDPRFDRYEEEIEINENSSEKTLLISPKNTLTFETTIESKENVDPVKKSISKKKAAATPGAGIDPIRAVQNLPGVNRSQGFGSAVIIQGSAPQDTRYTIDGHEIPLIFHFGGLSSVFNPELIDHFDFLSAGYQSNYGRALGGILDVESTALSAKHFKANAFLDIFNSGAFFETPIGELSHLAGGARVSYIGQVLKAALKKNENFSLSVAPSYSDLSLEYETKLSPMVRFRLLGIGSKDALEFIANNPIGGDPTLRGSFSNQIGFFRIIPEFLITHSANETTSASMGLGRDFIQTNIGSDYFSLKTMTATIRAEHRLKSSDEWKWVFGIDNRLAWSDVGFRLPVFFSQGGISNPIASSSTKDAEIKGIASNFYGLYLNPIYKPAIDSRFTFYPGLRFDYFDPISDARVSPRLGLRYALSPSLNLNASSGIYAQAPQEAQYSSSYGNPNLKSSTAYHLKLGLEKDLSEEWSRGSTFTSGLFARLFRSLVIPDTTSVYSNEGEGKAFGFENSFEYQMDPWNFYGSYTLSRSSRSDPKHSEYLYQYDQTHFLTLIAGVNLPRQWRISGRFRYVTGPLTTVPTGAVEDLDHDVFIPLRGELYNARLNAFSMLDLRFDKKWIYDTWTLSLYLDIQNVLNRANTESLQYAYDYSKSESVKGIPILPIFGLKGEF